MVEYFLNKKRKLAGPMRAFFRVIRSRHVNTIGFDEKNNCTVIAFNGIHGGKNVYYFNTTIEQCVELYETGNIEDNAEKILGCQTKEVLTG